MAGFIDQLNAAGAAKAKTDDGKPKKYSVAGTVTPEVHAAVKQLAAQTNVSVGEVVKTILTDALVQAGLVKAGEASK